MKITVNHVMAAGVSALRASQFLEPINAACSLYGISSRGNAVAAFLAQLAHETGGLQHLEEDLNYRDPTRVVQLFRTGFDTNKNGKADASEIEVAKGYLLQPERLANRAYASRNGNGPEASGDGWRFRGRGCFQLTGRANYAEAAAGTGRDYLATPDLVGQPSDAVLTAAWFWHRHDLTQKCVRGGIDATTRAINGPGMVGSDDRRKRCLAVLRVMNAEPLS
ncbi:MAG: glycoside hydrolase family 19 protein [Rubrivivax sp.]|nr:MAG: glycoside hydrolase family 19 protein [Rubrivivax sp.]